MEQIQNISNPLIWIDLEMTGLNTDKDQIIEMAVLLTDGQLSQLIEGPNLVINAPKPLLDGMDNWCIEHHGQSGLIKQCLESKITLQDAEQQVLDFLIKHNIQKKAAFLAGNSIHVDRMFLVKQMPKLIDWLHYRIIDVSTVKELCRFWYINDFSKAPAKQGGHRAMDDIRESIEELKFYRANIFKK